MPLLAPHFLPRVLVGQGGEREACVADAELVLLLRHHGGGDVQPLPLGLVEDELTGLVKAMFEEKFTDVGHARINRFREGMVKWESADDGNPPTELVAVIRFYLLGRQIPRETPSRGRHNPTIGRRIPSAATAPGGFSLGLHRPDSRIATLP